MSLFFSELLALIFFLGLNSALAAARAAMVSASKARLRQMHDQQVDGAKLALSVAEDATRLIATLKLAQTICRFFVAALSALMFTLPLAEGLRGWPSLAEQAYPLAFLIVVTTTALAVVGVIEVIPEAWAWRAPENSALFFAPLVAALEWVLAPFVRLMLALSARVTSPIAGQRTPLVTQEEIKTLVDAGEEGGAIEEDEKEMIYSIFDISDTLAREIMVPRIDVLAFDVEMPAPAAVEAVLQAGHSRVPVYQDNIDHVLGLLYAKDLLRMWKEGGQAATLSALLRPAYFIPETKKVNELLAELQQQRIHLAIVVDEYGGTAGIVTLEDIVEEIVGEIRDEYDANEEAQMERVSDTEYIFDARIDLDEVNELLKLELPTTDSDSLSGFIYTELGHVPLVGEVVHTANAQFEVLTVVGRRIRKVRARLAPPADLNSPPPDTPSSPEETSP